MDNELIDRGVAAKVVADLRRRPSIDAAEFARLAREMHKAAEHYSQAKLAAVAAEQAREDARKAMDRAASEWRKYVSECSGLDQIPNTFDLC